MSRTKDKLSQVKKRIKEKLSQIERKTEDKLSQVNKKLSQVDAKLLLLALTLDGYLNIRNCFFVVFLCNYLNRKSDNNNKVIKIGN